MDDLTVIQAGSKPISIGKKLSGLILPQATAARKEALDWAQSQFLCPQVATDVDHVELRRLLATAVGAYTCLLTQAIWTGAMSAAFYYGASANPADLSRGQLAMIGGAVAAVTRFVDGLIQFLQDGGTIEIGQALVAALLISFYRGLTIHATQAWRALAAAGQTIASCWNNDQAAAAGNVTPRRDGTLGIDDLTPQNQQNTQCP